MFTERLLIKTFLISFLIHALIILYNPITSFIASEKKEHKIVVSYAKAKPEVKKPQKGIALKRLSGKAGAGKVSKGEPFMRLDSTVISGKNIPPPYIDREKVFAGPKMPVSKSASFTKPAFLTPDTLAIKRKISLPPIDMGKINNPSYISYYQVVREKIRRAAYQNYSRSETGEVYLSFVISRDGYLKDVRLVEEKSVNNAYLRSVALRSVRDVAPLPDFPKDLDYAQLSFNIVISFEVE
jgi:TonB family protein